MEYLTKKCSAVGHPEISIFVADSLPLTGNWLCEFFDLEVRNGRRFQANETVQIGWMITILKKVKSGLLELWEPDFDSMPIKWCRGATNTLRHLIIQRGVCEVLGCVPVFPSLEEAGIIEGLFSDSTLGFVMSREHPKGADSGWRFRPTNCQETVESYKSLYEVTLAQSGVIPYLALPPESIVEYMGANVEIKLSDMRVASCENSALDKIARATDLI